MSRLPKTRLNSGSFVGSDFAMAIDPKSGVTPTLYDLPPSINRELGRIIVRCSYLEFYLQSIIWRLLQITVPMGRIATRMPRAEDRVDMIRDLAIVRKITLDENKLATLKKNIRGIWERRDTLAHGVWTKAPDNRWLVIKQAGNWPEHLATPVRSRRIMPEALTVNVDALRTITEGLDNTIESARKLSDLIQLPTPPEEHPEQFARRDRPQGRRQPKPSPPPKSLRE